MALASGDFHAVPLASHANPIAVDYDPVQRKVYWTDVAEKVIKCALLNGSEETVVRQLGPSKSPLFHADIVAIFLEKLIGLILF